MKIGFQIEARLCVTFIFHKSLVKSVVLRRYDGGCAGCRAAPNGIRLAEYIADACLF